MRAQSFLRVGPVTFALVTWLSAEVLAFVLVAGRVGIGGAILIGLATTLIGLTMLRKIGAGAIRGLRQAMAGREPSPGAMLDGSLAAFGAVLLILPGFLSDLVGLALAAPSVRQWLAHRFGAVRVPGRAAVVAARPRTLDLGPSDWHAVIEARPEERHRKPDA